MTFVSQDDQLLGTIFSFPTVLHARASFSFDMNLDSLQKALVSALASLRDTPIFQEVTISNRDGYSPGQVVFKIGIGDGDGFDILDDSEADRVLNRIENRGPFDTLDLSFHIHYRLEDGRRHKVHEDHYITRLAFRHGRVELFVHHLKGVKRVDSVELVQILLRYLNSEIKRLSLPEVELDHVSST